MLKAPSAWELDPLEAATRQFMSTGGYTDQQEGMRFIAKLENCRRVAAGYGNGGSASGSSFTNATGITNATGFSEPVVSPTGNQITVLAARPPMLALMRMLA